MTNRDDAVYWIEDTQHGAPVNCDGASAAIDSTPAFSTVHLLEARFQLDRLNKIFPNRYLLRAYRAPALGEESRVVQVQNGNR